MATDVNKLEHTKQKFAAMSLNHFLFSYPLIMFTFYMVTTMIVFAPFFLQYCSYSASSINFAPSSLLYPFILSISVHNILLY
jgi:hypothetical protein